MFGVRNPDFYMPVITGDGSFMVAKAIAGKLVTENTFTGSVEECDAIAVALNARDMERYKRELLEVTSKRET